MSYGINTVVGGFGESLTPEKALPFAIARTYYEHQMLRALLTLATGGCKKSEFKSALDVGCGYGRNIPVLKEFSKEVTGVERDEELVKIARQLNPTAPIYLGLLKDFSNESSFPGAFDLVMTFTFLQHLRQSELEDCAKAIRFVTAPNAALILAEETDPELVDESTEGRTAERYQHLFPEFSLILKLPRIVEPTFPKPDSGTYMLFKKHK